jgi:hypothetical protein
VVVAIVMMPASPRDQAAQVDGPNPISTSDKTSSVVPAKKVLWNDDFSSGKLDPARWEEVVNGDFREKLIDVVDGRLRLRADTMSTDDRTVKSLGVRSKEPLKAPATIAATLDWNKQANGSYLTAEMHLNWAGQANQPAACLKVQYIGVPPGKNGRAMILLETKDRPPSVVYDEGWPERQKEGRLIEVKKIKLVTRLDGIEFWEDDKLLFNGKLTLPPTPAHLSLLISSHSNYPAREIYFDDVSVTSE